MERKISEIRTFINYAGKNVSELYHPSLNTNQIHIICSWNKFEIASYIVLSKV